MKKKETGANRNGILGRLPISGWLYAVAAVVYCECLLHLWVTEEMIPGRFAAVLAFALGGAWKKLGALLSVVIG